jgi:hypothetical protein
VYLEEGVARPMPLSVTRAGKSVLPVRHMVPWWIVVRSARGILRK